jgi:hypothetical protein
MTVVFSQRLKYPNIDFAYYKNFKIEYNAVDSTNGFVRKFLLGLVGFLNSGLSENEQTMNLVSRHVSLPCH